MKRFYNLVSFLDQYGAVLTTAFARWLRAGWKALAVVSVVLLITPSAVHGQVSSFVGFDQGTCEYWVAPLPVGSDSNSGAYGSPWATLQHANQSIPDDSCVVWFMPGVYKSVTRLNRRFETLTVFKSTIPYQAVLQGNDSVLTISGAKNITLEGFDIQHSGPDAKPLLVAIDGSKHGWSEYVTLRNNIIHDSYNNDLLKIYNLSRFITIENNVFYNQGPPEEHMDVNSVTDVVIQDNIFFNDYEDSGRINENRSKQYIVIKDSNGEEDGLVGSRRVTVRRNIFLNWEGQDDETFIQVGLDEKPYHEAVDIHIENNLLIGNSENQVGAAFGVRGAKDVYFVNNTVTGNLPSKAYAAWITTSGQNPNNQNIFLYNNIWSDSTGTMGKDLQDNPNEFSNGHPDLTENLVLDNNLYWNGWSHIPQGDVISPLKDDEHRIVANPLLATDQKDVILPFWDGNAFLSGNDSIREEFIRLVETYGKTHYFSMARNNGNPAYAPPDDILGRLRDDIPDVGAYEQQNIFDIFSLFRK